MSGFSLRLIKAPEWLAQYSKSTAQSDIQAGITGAIITLPQVIAYALIAGMPAEYGLYTAMVATVIAAFMGSSYHLVTGPAAAISIVVMSIASEYATIGSQGYISTVLTLTLLTGSIQLGLGLLRLGALVNFISHTVIVGFTSGAALLIAASQLPAVMGVAKKTSETTEPFYHYVWSLVLHPEHIHLASVTVALITIIIALVIKQWIPRLPYLVIALVAGSLSAFIIDTQHTMDYIGAIPASLPTVSVALIDTSKVSDLFSGAFALAMLGLIEAVTIARSLARKSHQHLSGNREFIGQGAANIGTSLLSGFASSGSFTRSAANYDAGAKTPVASLVMALGLALIVFFLPHLTRYLPAAAVAGCIIVIAYNLFKINEIISIVKASRHDAWVLSLTFFAALLLELQFAIYVGVIFSLVFYLQRTSKPTIIDVAPIIDRPKRPIRNVKRFTADECPQIKIIRIDGSLFFGAVDHIQQHLRKLASSLPSPPKIIVVGKGINFIDIAAIEMLEQEIHRIEVRGGHLLVCSLKGTVLDEMEKNGGLRKLGKARFCETPEEAIEIMMHEADSSICQHCTKRIFKECASKPTPIEPVVTHIS
ncbi:SulP family inorganic anion transporter [Neptunomonas phycophila]|uniref:SulP family inorganic anion transporter n=1 Tax=Neptunomonas phycophila TaxID=1572645 RepID=UPI0026E400C7|nr:SulP family inorganic anion transporter [Neptunomonas phycophila]MDO6785933.1 SulP family inorganic anion transporter [Neptunomonas phycophila]